MFNLFLYSQRPRVISSHAKTCEEIKRVEKFVISRCRMVTKKLTQAYESDMKTLLLMHEAEKKFTGAFNNES